MSCPDLSSQWQWPWQFQSPYRLILDHILVSPTRSDLPLPTIYELSCSFGSRKSSPKRTPSGSQSSPTFKDIGSLTPDFTKKLKIELSKLPYQPTPRSTTFLTTKLRECFPSDLILIDVSRALAGLDHLKDLEFARRKELASTFRRLGIERNQLEDEDSIADLDEAVKKWLSSVETTEEHIAALYTHLHTSLRHWIFVGQLIRTFHPRKCISLLNTLYPPFSVTQPTASLTPAILRLHRERLFSYVTMIEHDEERALELRDQGTDDRHGHNSWAAIYLVLDKYISLANDSVAANVHLDSVPTIDETGDRRNEVEESKKPASGLGILGLPKKDSKANLKIEPCCAASGEAPMPSPPYLEQSHAHSTNTTTKLNRLSLNIKAIGRNAASSPRSPKYTSPSTNSSKHGVLRKLKSMGNIGGRRASAGTIRNGL